MPNTKSAKKALKQSIKKHGQNLFWKNRIRTNTKRLKKMLDSKEGDILKLKAEESALQKVLDKASKNKVIHKNKARRLKSRFAQKITAHEKTTKKKSKSS